MRIHPVALLLPLALAACAPAMQPATRYGAAQAVDVRFPRVAPRSLAVQLRQRAHVAFLEVRPGSETVAEWLGDAAPRAMRPGSHLVFQAGGYTHGNADQRACDRPGERVAYDWMAAPGSVNDMRTVTVHGRTFYCIRQATTSPAPADRHLLVLVAPQPVDAGALERAREAFNHQYAGSPLAGEELAQAMAPFVAVQWPGSAAYYVRVRG